ncbi:Alpha/Beta hydrolase protein [Cyathus striatus]|nr:Alpha/Beta hydrolase protein [Cyathus striatus]
MGHSDVRTETTLFHFPAKPAYLSLKGAKNDDGTPAQESLRTLLEMRCRSLFKPFYPKWWLKTGHLQTIYNIMGNLADVDQLWFRRQLLRLMDEGTIGLDFTPIDFREMKHDVPIVVVAHGLTGGSHEPYLRAAVKPIVTSTRNGGLGYRAVIVTFRGCAGVPLTSPKLYTSGHTDDFRLCLAYLQHSFPHAQLLGLGFSLGANILTKYLEEEGSMSRLSSAITLSCPWDMESNGHGQVHLSTFLGRNLYARGMGRNLQALVRKYEKVFRKYPDNPIYKELDATLALRMPMLHEFDDTFSRKVGGEPPLFPMSSVDEYYRWCSTDKQVGKIRVPYLAINSEDDPVVTKVPMDGGGNGLVVMVLTKGGGHLGWFKAQPKSCAERWTTQPILEWLKMMGDEIDYEHIRARAAPTYKDESGFIKERGKDGFGCKEIDGGPGLIDGNFGEKGFQKEIYLISLVYRAVRKMCIVIRI